MIRSVGGLGGKDYSGNPGPMHQDHVRWACSGLFLLKKGKTDAPYVGIMYAITGHLIHLYFLSGSLTSSHIITWVSTTWLPSG